MRAPNLSVISRHVASLPSQANSDALMRAARRAAEPVRLSAARHHSIIGIRISVKADGLRVTMTGRDAQRYENLMKTELARVMPAARQEIRELIRRAM